MSERYFLVFYNISVRSTTFNGSINGNMDFKVFNSRYLNNKAAIVEIEERLLKNELHGLIDVSISTVLTNIIELSKEDMENFKE